MIKGIETTNHYTVVFYRVEINIVSIKVKWHFCAFWKIWRKIGKTAKRVDIVGQITIDRLSHDKKRGLANRGCFADGIIGKLLSSYK